MTTQLSPVERATRGVYASFTVWATKQGNRVLTWPELGVRKQRALAIRLSYYYQSGVWEGFPRPEWNHHKDLQQDLQVLADSLRKLEGVI